MARQTGLIKIKGTLDNVNFYKTKDGDLARMKTSVDANRIKNDPSFERTRENNEEFGNSANAGKLVRDAVRPMALNASDGKVVSRLTQVMTRIKNMDTTSVRGKRNVGEGILDPNALLMIKGVEFNREALLSAILFKPFTVDTATGEIVITDLIPQMDIVWPQGATHIQLTAGFADIFVVFAQIDGDKFTGFIVERALEGISLGAEEAKMGIKGSSTRQVFFENVKVPVENVLGEIGKGHKIAFNILNIGRIKLAAGVLGGAKVIIDHSIQYANERKQFGVSISSFGAIKHKLAEQAIRTWATEAAMHRASRAIDHEEKRLKDSGKTLAESLLGAAEEYAIECALLKVKGSECLDYVADEGVQIYGGMGYSEEAPMAGAYRDSRINRIFEGTNEINRMLSVDMLMKKAMRGQIDLMSPAMAIQKEMTSMPAFGAGDTGLLGTEMDYVRNMKKCFLAVAGLTVQNLMMELQKEQEILMNLSDMMSEIYLCESAILRTKKLAIVKGEDFIGDRIAMTQVFINDSIERMAISAKNVATSWAEGDMLRMLMLAIKRYTKHEFVNTKNLRRQVADTMLAAGCFCFND